MTRGLSLVFLVLYQVTTAQADCQGDIADASSVCGPNTVCDDSECKCKSGFAGQWQGDQLVCWKKCADDCPVDSTCSNCDVNSVCKTIVTTSINVCMCNVVAGYVGDGNECSDCSEDSDCGLNEECVGTPQVCTCMGGYSRAADGGCSIACSSTSDCAKNAQCNATTGTCECNSGYKGDPYEYCYVPTSCSSDTGCGGMSGGVAFCTSDKFCECNGLNKGDGISCSKITCANHMDCVLGFSNQQHLARCDTDGVCKCSTGYHGDGYFYCNANQCLYTGQANLPLSTAFGKVENFHIDGEGALATAANAAAFITQAVDIPSMVSTAFIANATTPEEKYTGDLSYAMPQFNLHHMSSLNMNWLFFNGLCSFSNGDFNGINRGSVDVTYSSTKKCVPLDVQTDEDYTSVPPPLTDLEVISVLLSQEVNGPPSNVIEKLYNLFWLERRASMGNKFVACFREGISFGKHQTGRLNFIATTFDTPGSSDHDVGGPDGDVLKLQSGKAYFNLTEVGSNEMCLYVRFTRSYVKSPYVLATAELEEGSDGEIAIWVEKVCLKDFKLCIRRTGVAYDGASDNVTAHYAVIGSLSICDGLEPPPGTSPYKQCLDNPDHADDEPPYKFECISNCTEYHSQFCSPPGEAVCASDFGTYENSCEMSKYVCDAYLEADHGSINIENKAMCAKPGYEIGHMELESVSGNRLTHFCSDIVINETLIHPFADTRIIVTPNWGGSDPSKTNAIHGGTGAWIEEEETNDENGPIKTFKACCRTTYSPDHHGEKCSVNYLIYQKNLKHRTAGYMTAGEAVDMPADSTSGCALATELDGSNSVDHLIFSPTITGSESPKQGLISWIETAYGTLEDAEGAITVHYSHRFCAKQMQQYSTKLPSYKVHFITYQPQGFNEDQYSQMSEGEHMEGVSCSIIDNAEGNLDVNGGFEGLLFQSVEKNVTEGTALKHFSGQFSPNAISAWGEDSNATDAKICIEDMTTDDQHHSDTTLHVLYIPKP